MLTTLGNHHIKYTNSHVATLGWKHWATNLWNNSTKRSRSPLIKVLKGAVVGGLVIKFKDFFKNGDTKIHHFQITKVINQNVINLLDK